MENVNTERDSHPEESRNDHTMFYAVSSAKVAINFPIVKEKSIQKNPSNNSEEPIENELPLEDEGESGRAQPIAKNVIVDNGDELVFYGVVRDENSEVLEGAAVILFACYSDGQEKPLGYAMTGSNGEYVINIPDKIDYNDLVRFKARAGKAINKPAKGADQVNDMKKHDLNYRKNDFNSFLKLLFQR